jgi:hypothetical protein
MKVDLFISGELVDGLKPDAVVALTKQAAKWNNFITRSADFSNVFELEPTAQLMRLWGHPDEVGSLSEQPYKRLPYEIRVDGVPISAGFAQLERVTDVVEVQLFSGFADFLQLIGDMKTTDIDVSDQNHRWTLANVNNLRNREANTGGVVYPHINYRRFHAPTPAVTLTDFYPAIYPARFVDDAAASVGWSVEGFDNRWVWPFSKVKFEGKNVTLAKVQRTTNQVFSGSSAINFFPLSFNNVVTDFYNVFGTDLNGRYGFQAHYNGNYTFKFKLILDVVPTVNSIVGLRFFGNGTPIDLGSVPVTTAQTNYEINATLDYNYTSQSGNVSIPFIADFFLDLSVLTTVGGSPITVTVLPGSFWECTAHQGSTLANGWVDCNQIAPAVTIKDILLQCAQRLCAAVIADPVNRVLRFVRLDDIERKAPINLQPYLNESDKPEINYELGDYARENVFGYIESDDADPFPGSIEAIPDAIVTIADDRLEPTKEAVKPFFAKTYLLPIGNATAPLAVNTQVPCIFRYTTPSTPYLLPDIDPKQRSGRIDLETDPTQARFVPDDWNALIAENYQTLIKMLNKTKVVKYAFWLPLAEFLNLDTTTPVFVEGQKWYVRKVNQFKVNESDSVEIELIRL